MNNRRRFLQSSTAALVGGTLGFPAITRAKSPNGKLQHACIGVGGMGYGDLQNFISHTGTEVVAICDVDEAHLARAAQDVPNARKYSDWRELLAKEGAQVDSVNVTVPDHMHAAIGLSAIRAGKHTYCQKPLCHDVAEVRAMNTESKRMDVITQLGTQMASGFGDRLTTHFLRAGAIGKIKHVYLCSNRPGAIEAYRPIGPRPEKGETPPKNLNWEHWCGTAPLREFVPSIYHPSKWRAWQDFGTGWSGDIGCHIFHAAWKGLGLTAPQSVIAEVQQSWKENPKRRADTWPQSDHITWIFAGNELTAEKELTVEWFDGLMYPPDDVRKLFTDRFPGKEYPGEAAMFIGTEGALLLPHSSSPLFFPSDKFATLEKPKLEPRNHYHHFLDAILGKVKNESHFQQTGPMTEAILLGTVAIRTPDTKLEWDADAMRITNNEAANGLLRRKYRDGWEVKLA